MVDPGVITALLARLEQGDAAARDALLPIVYEELCRVARRLLSGELGNVSLRTNDLVHEAYERLFPGTPPRWESRIHFIRAASLSMRRILVDHARARNAAKRGGGAARVSLSDVGAVSPGGDVDVERLDDALRRLEALDPRQVQIVELRFFAGLSVEETARALDLSAATVKREWRSAKAWLYRELIAG
jgi:RNA polymerase sigma-70 factor (ECF subfamily)